MASWSPGASSCWSAPPWRAWPIWPRRARARLGLDAEKIAKGRGQFDAGHLAVVVVASPKPSEKIPPIEQTLSAGAVCLGAGERGHGGGLGRELAVGLARA